MNWFRKNKTPKEQSTHNHMHQDNINPNMENFKRIFVEESQPIMSQEEVSNDNSEALETAPQTKKSLIDNFLGKDYFNYGYDDGYNYQSTEMMNRRIDEFCSEFSVVLENEIERCTERENDLLIQQVKCSDQDLEEVRQGLQIVINHTRSKIVNLRTQADLCCMREGLITKAVSAYRNGFLKGIKDFHETQIFNNNIGLINL